MKPLGTVLKTNMVNFIELLHCKKCDIMKKPKGTIKKPENSVPTGLGGKNMGCVFTLAAIILIPILIAIIAIFLGAIGGSILTAIISTIIFVVLTNNGIFMKYKNSTKEWQRVLATISKALLILIMVISYITTLVLATIVVLMTVG